MQLRNIIIECKKNNMTAQRNLYDRYAKKMFLLCRRYVRNDVVAEEVVMKGFLKFFSTLKEFEYRSDEATEGWMVRIMVTICLKHLDRSKLIVVSLEHLEEPATSEDLLSQIAAKEIYTLITQLPTGYRVVFNMFCMEGMTHEEIATALGITESTSRSQITKARRLLQEMLIKNNKEYENRRTK